MQTFLPFPDFARCASVLDGKRLRKQIVEGSQILATLRLPSGTKAAWVNHPAVAMWRGYEAALTLYCVTIQCESRKRGYAPNIVFDTDDCKWSGGHHDCIYAIMPPWLGHPLLHLSHKANLLRKDPEHYRPHLGLDIQPVTGYWWPVTCGKTSREHTAMWENNA
jgi:hypothetical protein